jgi:hypothetical protein
MRSLVDRRRYKGMASLRVLSWRGDTKVDYDVRKAESGDSEQVAAVVEAERIFREERARGATAFRLDATETAIRIDEFDREADQIVMVPRIAGGA